MKNEADNLKDSTETTVKYDTLLAPVRVQCARAKCFKMPDNTFMMEEHYEIKKDV